MHWLSIEITHDSFPGSRSLKVYGNPPIDVYPIVGETELEQLQNIKSLGETMGQGKDELAIKIGDLIECDKENMNMDYFVEDLFGSAYDLTIDGVESGVEIADGRSVLDVLVDVGEWVAEFFAV